MSLLPFTQHGRAWELDVEGAPCGRSSDAGSESCSKWLLSHVSAGEAHGVGERSDHSGAGSRSRRVRGTPTHPTLPHTHLLLLVRRAGLGNGAFSKLTREL